MSLFALLLVLAVGGLAVYGLNKLPMAPGWKTLINAVAIICAGAFIMQAFGIWSYLFSIRVPQVG